MTPVPPVFDNHHEKLSLNGDTTVLVIENHGMALEALVAGLPKRRRTSELVEQVVGNPEKRVIVYPKLIPYFFDATQ